MRTVNIEEATVRFAVNGRVFSFVADGRFERRLSDLAREASENADECGRMGINDGERAVEFLSRAIDILIGDGTVDTIFGDREPDATDLCDVLGVISDAFHEYRNSRIARIRGTAV